MIALALHEGHNASAAIACDGKIIAAASEERFRRVKNYLGFPLEAAKFCLQSTGIVGSNVDRAAMVTRHIDPLVARVRRSTHFSPRDHVRQQHEYFARLHAAGAASQDEVDVRRAYAASCDTHQEPEYYDFSRFGDYRTQHEDAERFFHIRQEAICRLLEIPPNKIKLVDHHQCHAAYAYCASPFRDTAVLVFTADCIGDGASATVWRVDERGHATELDRSHSQILGYIWRYVTLLLGMIPLRDEYKVMGLAPYGRRRHKDAEAEFAVWQQMKGAQWHRPPRFSHYFEVRRRLEGLRFDDIAGGLQSLTESLLAKWFSGWVRKSHVATVVYSGGLALNVKANMTLAEWEGIKRFHVPPGGSDESLAIGAAYLSSLDPQDWASAQPLETAYLGPDCRSDDVTQAVDRCRHEGCRILNDSPDDVARLLASGKTVGRCCGRMEFGPRALGNRSILARANDLEMPAKLNHQVKLRDWWMPFAPLVRECDAPSLFASPGNVDGSFMTVCFNPASSAKSQLAATCHPLDGTVRPQALRDGQNDNLRQLLDSFIALTGQRALVNTSFNLHGEPIVLGPREAVDTFLRSGLDAVLLPGALIERKNDGKSLDTSG